MALEKSGVQLVAENESGFLGALTHAQKAVAGFEAQIGKASTTLSKFNTTQTGVGKVGTEATQAAGGLNIMQLATAGLAGFLGGVLVNAASAAVSGFINLGKSAFAVTAAYETLGVSMQTLLAREIRNAGAATDMASAFDMAAPAAQELLGWIEELAIKSPFDNAGVAAAYQTLQVYGFLSLGAEDVADAQEKGVVSAQRLTEALINQASVSARGSESMGLVAYALGQIRTSGKLLMQDLRQLTNAGVDVNAILGEMGYSLADVGKESIDSNAFLLKFTETIERDLGGAALMQAGTLSGLANSIADLGKKYLREFFGPFNEGTGKMGGILGVVQPILQKFVDTLLNEKLINAVQTLGLMIGEGLSGGFSTLSNLLTNLVSTFAAPFDSAANNAFSWGANIIIQLAQGIINAAGSILVNAINFVANILASWFAPGSPPAVAPNIDNWGTEAMGEWLHGFTTADFSVLKGIQGPLQSALQTMMQAGDIDAQGVADTYASITAGLSEALATGGDPSAIFEQIAQSAGEFGPELAELAELQFNLAGGLEAVQVAEENLAAARKAQESAGKAVMQLTQEYNDLLRSGADDATLQTKLEEINAAETAKDLAGQQAVEAEAQLDIAKDNLGVMEEQVRLQAELVNQLIELARLQAQAIPPETPIPPEAVGGGAGGTPGGGGLPEITLPDPGEAVAQFMDTVLQSIKDAAAQMFQPIIDAWNSMVAAVLGAWDNFIASLNASGLLEQLQGIWDSLVSLAQIGVGILLEFIGRGLETIANIWNTHKAKVDQIWGQLWGLVASVAGGILGLIVSNIDERLKEAVTFFESNRKTITNIIEGFWSNYETVADLALTNVLGFVSDRLVTIQSLWDEYGVRILNATDRTWDTIAELFWHYLGGALEAVETILGTITEFWDKHGGSVQIIIGAYLGYVGTLFDFYMTSISKIVTFVFEFIATFLENNGESIKTMISAVWAFITGIFSAAVTVIGGIVDFLAGLLTGDFELMKTGLTGIWQGLWDGIGVVLTTAWISLKTIAAAGWAFLVTTLTGLGAILTGLWAAMWLVIQDAIEYARNYIEVKLQALQAVWDAIWGAIKAKGEEIVQAIKDFIEEKIRALFESMGLDLDEMSARWTEIWTDVKDIASEIWDRIYEKISEKVSAAKQWVLDRVGELKTWWNTTWKEISDKITEIWDGIFGKVSEQTDATKGHVETQITLLKTWWDDTWALFRDKIVEIWDGIIEKVKAKVQTVYDDVTGKIQEILTAINGKVGEFKTMGADLINGMKDGVLGAVGDLIEAVTTAIQNAIQAAKDALDMESPSKVFMNIGHNVMFGLAEGIDQEKHAPVNALGETINAMINPGTVNGPSNIVNNNSMQVSFNNNVSSGIDVAALDQHILRVVKGAFGR